MSKRLAIAGSGAIACGLAATAAHHGPVLLLARSESSADRARATRREDAQPAGGRSRPRARADRDRPAGARRRAGSWSRRSSRTTTSRRACSANWTRSSARRRSSRAPPPRCRSSGWREASGRPERFLGLHVFNPVTKMELVELVFPPRRQRAHARGGAGAVRGLREDPRRGARHPRLRRQPAAVPLPVQRRAPGGRDGHGPRRRGHVHELGAGHPMGPLALLDLVGLDVSKAIGETIGETDAARACRSWSPKARSGARAGAGSTPTSERPGPSRSRS